MFVTAFRSSSIEGNILMRFPSELFSNREDPQQRKGVFRDVDLWLLGLGHFRTAAPQPLHHALGLND